jgi:hypothetical protein
MSLLEKIWQISACSASSVKDPAALREKVQEFLYKLQVSRVVVQPPFFAVERSPTGIILLLALAPHFL